MDGTGGRDGLGLGQRAGCRVLVVDDNIDAAESLAELLRLHGHCVVTAHTGPDALRAAAVHTPDVVFLDLKLFGMDGFEVARRLRPADGSYRPRLLIAVTGFAADEDRRRTRAAGFDAHLVKPVEPAAYLALL